MNFSDELKKMNACIVAIEWVGGRTFEQAWAECERADWLLWYLAKSKKATRKQLVRLAAMCAETVLHLYEKKYPDDSRVRDCITACYDFSDDKITLGELEKFRAAACAAADDADAAFVAAVAAAFVAADAASVADADAAYAYAAYAYAAVVAADAVAAAVAAADAAAAAADKHHKLMCNMIRKEVRR